MGGNGSTLCVVEGVQGTYSGSVPVVNLHSNPYLYLGPTRCDDPCWDVIPSLRVGVPPVCGPIQTTSGVSEYLYGTRLSCTSRS